MSHTETPQLDAWIRVFTELGANGPPSMTQLERITAEDVRFHDPFNDLVGRESLLRLLEHTHAHVRDLKFEVLDTVQSENRAYLKWTMTGKIPVLGAWSVTGMSEIQFSGDGRASMHQDYWDASVYFYNRLPVIGWLLRRLRSVASI